MGDDDLLEEVRRYLEAACVRCQFEPFPFLVASGPSSCPRWATNAYEQDMVFRCDEHRIAGHMNLAVAGLVRAYERAVGARGC